MRKRCCVCGKLTEKWQSVNGSFIHCFDGCKSTTGYDHRQQVTPEGKMAYRATPRMEDHKEEYRKKNNVE